jgi:hypothetical protein
MIDIRCPHCGALNLKIEERELIDVKIGCFHLSARGKFNEIEITCRNRNCQQTFMVE